LRLAHSTDQRAGLEIFLPERRKGGLPHGSFAFFLGVFFHQTEYIFMWWIFTMAVFVGGFAGYHCANYHLMGPMAG